MNNESKTINSPDSDHEKDTPESGRPYTKPELVDYGPIRNVTLGGSPGFGDSGPDSGTRFP